MNDLETVRDEIAGHLEKMARLFKPGVKVTFLARHPGKPDQDFMLTDDTLGEIADLVRRRQGTKE